MSSRGAKNSAELREEMVEGRKLLLSAEMEWDELFRGHNRELLEKELLPQFLLSQRWFGGKARTIQAVRIRDWSFLADEAPRSALVLMDVTYTEGEPDTYFIPMAIARREASDSIQQEKTSSVVWAGLHSGKPAILFDATADPVVCHALLSAIEQGRRFDAIKGTVRAFPTRAFAEARGDPKQPLQIVLGSAEQSNTSILYGNRLILKLFRRLPTGPNPDFEIGRHLTEQGMFDRIPKLAGAIEYEQPGLPYTTLGMLQELVPNQGDGWKRALEDLGQFYEKCAGWTERPGETQFGGQSVVGLSETRVPTVVRERIGAFLEAASTLGKRTAEMHLALAVPTEDPAFLPEPLTSDDLRLFSQELRVHGSQVLAELSANLDRFPSEVADMARFVLDQRQRLLERLRCLEQMEGGILKIRIHGDYHLGQVLCVNDDFVILDFEGEPARSLAERRAKYPALKDVAGMLRSFSYAAYGALLLLHTAQRPEDFPRLQSWARFWERWNCAVFLKAYRKTAANAAFLPANARQFQELLEVFLLDKALYELRYEMNNRPLWMRIPLVGLLELASEV